MTRDQARGQAALANLDQYHEPQLLFIGSDAEKLYDLERQRSNIIERCAKEWAKLGGYGQTEYWTRSIPQALHDTLETYQTECGIIAAEAFLKRHGWTVTRPAKQI